MSNTKIISIISQKGGVAKSVSSLNLAYFLSQQGKKVLLIDADSQANSTNVLCEDIESIDTGLYDILLTAMGEDDTPWYDCIYDTSFENLYICPAQKSLSNFELKACTQYKREEILKSVIDEFKVEFDYIIIDSPPTFGLMTTNIIVASNYVIIPTTANVLGAMGLDQLIHTYNLIKKALNPNIKILGILITIYFSSDSSNKRNAEELIKNYGDLIFKTRIRKNTTIDKANENHMPVIAFDKKSNGCKDYISFGNEVLERLKSVEGEIIK